MSHVGHGFGGVKSVRALDDAEGAQRSKRIKVDKGAAGEADFAAQWSADRAVKISNLDAAYVCPPSAGCRMRK